MANHPSGKSYSAATIRTYASAIKSVVLESGIMPVVVVSLFAMAYGPFKIVLVYKPHVTRKFFAALLLSIYN